MHSRYIPFFDFSYINQLLEAEINEAFHDFYRSNWYILGKKLSSFEEQYAAFSGTQHCVGVANGLDALEIALKVLNIGPGDEVIVPSNTFIATWLAISHVGATIVPVEPLLTTSNIDPYKIEAAITAKTKAIMPVHLYGQACQMDEIMAIAYKHKLLVVEDNAQAHGATFKGKATGSFGHINATSFYPTKNFGALGDGGALTTDNADLARQAALMRNYGSEQKYHNEIVGYNSRLDELQAAFLSVKLSYLKRFTSERQEVAKQYDLLLANVNDIKLTHTAAGASHSYHLYVIHIDKREELQLFLKENGIETAIHYPVPPHLQNAYQHLGFKVGSFPIAEQLAKTCLSLPMYPGITTSDVGYVTDTIKRFYAKGAYN
ncbi:DegT/DnrJ/EryC1/StrS family aminotransferase [Mucilaginibacter pallidiroseus]|uniref:DegT/DnrJ/EryC1/StrS family aminotransferase n=1 Tax=Mucilaginibacter pallidiroseus TaxID=2599295 RepID=A0A563U0M4_9SPHI|nr:DegT/DnrJ/EryC1/StrS family aminotransferase [Mucilaginibacter pallidiroseus]TWR25177.1 DegT/DnrJ/EryC1/StrS family aminotransferase [Mucilaginibacter pallidiroseus]